ncbi:PepSY domain-containing protein [Alloalcanivorax xenomutans]|uniref:PepSY-associated TM helix domain-containing protein n=1 Tax=Alloalcanivorax xenomutans TaxID=1094342 RepID=UPI003A807DD0
MRRLIFTLHLYAGLGSGLLLALIGVTGSLLVFYPQLDQWLTPALTTPASTATPLPLQDILSRASDAVDGAEPRRLYLPGTSGDYHLVRFDTPPDAPGPLQVNVDPYTGKVAAVRTWGAYPMTWIYRLHYTLLAGTTGKYVVGVCGILLALFAITGVYLRWPKRGRWRRALAIERGKGRFRFYFDLHGALGLYLFPVLMVVALSGVFMVFRAPITSAVATLATVTPAPNPRSVPSASTPVTLDQAVAAAAPVFPGARLSRVYLPRSQRDSYRLAYVLPESNWQRYAASSVWVDQYSGEILEVWDERKLGAADTVLAWQFPLHNGEALGLPGRWLVFVSGGLPALLFVTGVYLWWRKRRLKRRR